MRMLHFFVVVLVFVRGVEPAAADPTTEKAERKANYRARLQSKLDAQFTGGPASDVLKAVGQAVVKKAVRGGWSELANMLSELANCGESGALTKTCSVLGYARIEDLIASPRILLDAFVEDVFRELTSKIQLSTAFPIAALATSWIAVGSDGLAKHLRPWLKKQLEGVELGSCPQDKAKAVAWVLANCYVESADFATCDASAMAASCAGGAEVVHVAELGAATFAAIDDNHPEKLPVLSVQLSFEWAKLVDEKSKDTLDGFETIFLGLLGHDWTRVVVGIGHLAEASKLDMKLIKIIGAIGQFAETYTSGGKPVEATAAREKVIEDLVTSLIDRTERDHGAVISLGGALGLFGGKRFNDSGSQLAMPVRLTVGLGLDTYTSKAHGLHLSLDAFDVGQYVTYSSGSLDVGSPDIKSSIVVGATLAYWRWSRETPLFIGAHASVSPFVRTMDNKPTYEAGLIVGVYVPLLDFN